MTNKSKLVFASLIAAVAISANAAAPLNVTKAFIEAGLKQHDSDVKVDEVRNTPIAGLFEIRSGRTIFYSDDSGRYVLDGHLIDTKEKVDVTQKKLNELGKISFPKLPFTDAMKVVRGDGSRKIAIFEDPNCGYCKKMESELLAVNNITVYVFLIPILGPDSLDKSKDIWCSTSKERIWVEWMTEGKRIPAAGAGCDTSVLARNSAMAKDFGVQGTPAIFFEDGSRAPGAISAAELNKKLAQK